MKMPNIMKNDTSIFTVFYIILLLVCTSNAKAIISSHQSIAEAKFTLEQLQRQLLGVEKECQMEIQKETTDKIKIAPKDEFETTKEFEVRETQANQSRRQIEERINSKKETLKEGLYRQINGILITEYAITLEARLSSYNADMQVFAIYILKENIDSSFVLRLDNFTAVLDCGALYVPRFEAKELKENFSKAFAICSIGLRLNAQNIAEEYLISAKIPFRNKIYQLKKEMNLVRAMDVIYGNFNNNSKWRGEPYYINQDLEYQDYEAISIFNKQFRENNTNKFIIVTSSVNYKSGSCHGCGAKIGVAIFSQKDSIWKLEIGQKDVGTFGAWSYPPDIKLVKLGLDRYALSFTTKDDAQGVEMVCLDFIDRINGAFKVILNLYISEDTSGYGTFKSAADNITFDSKIENIHGKNPVYDDLKITAHGKKGVKVGKDVIMRPFEETKVYKFSGTEYKLYYPH